MENGLFLLILFGLIAFWCLISFIIAQSGWSAFIPLYRVKTIPQGLTYRMEGGQINDLGGYARSLNITLCREGIGIAVIFLFRCGHPPLFIPWDKVRSIEERTFLFFKHSEITIAAAGQTFALLLQISAKGIALRYKQEAEKLVQS
jgi:hypothetical protein